MTTLETILVAVIIGYGLVGLKAGLIQAIGSIIGVVVGTVVATRTFRGVASFALPLFGGNELASVITSFIVVFLFSSRLVGIIVHLIDKAFNILAIFPGLKSLNRLGGMVLGILEGSFVVGVILLLVTRLPLSEETAQMLERSSIIQFLLGIARWLLPFFPEALEKARSVIG